MTEDDIKEATAYLRNNHELWSVLNIEDGSKLVAAPLAQGEHNANYIFSHPRTGERYVLRFNYISQLNLENQSSYEFNVLKELEPSGRAPKPLYADDSRVIASRGANVMEFVEGRMLDFENRADLAEAARMLADVHSVIPSKNCSLLKPNDALEDLIIECRRMFSVYLKSSFVDKKIVSYVKRFFYAAQQALSCRPAAAECNHIINTEMVSAHFLMNDNGSPGHIVDWEKAILGEATRDVAYFLAPTTTIWDTDFIFTPAQREAFIENYWEAVAGRFSRGSFDDRFDAYTMANCLRGITYCTMAWVQYHDPDHPLKNAKTFEKLKVYLSEGFLDLLTREYFHLG